MENHSRFKGYLTCYDCPFWESCSALNKYRLERYSEIDTLKLKFGEKIFYQFAREIYDSLDQMKGGDILFYLKTYKGEHIPLFIKLACRYIIDHRDYEFAADYSYIKRLQ